MPTYFSQLSDSHISFTVAGQSLLDLSIEGDSSIEYASTDRLGSSLETAASWGRLMADIGKLIGTSKHTLTALTFSWPCVGTIRHRAVTKLDAMLEGTQLIVLDVAQWLKQEDLTCDKIREDTGVICGGLLKSKEWMSNATCSKGVGSVHTIYMANVNRRCSICKKTTSDSTQMARLPICVRSMIPVERSVKSGLPNWLATMALSLVPEGCTFNMITKAANALLQTRHAEQVLIDWLVH